MGEEFNFDAAPAAPTLSFGSDVAAATAEQVQEEAKDQQASFEEVDKKLYKGQ